MLFRHRFGTSRYLSLFLSFPPLSLFLSLPLFLPLSIYLSLHPHADSRYLQAKIHLAPSHRGSLSCGGVRTNAFVCREACFWRSTLISRPSSNSCHRRNATRNGKQGPQEASVRSERIARLNINRECRVCPTPADKETKSTKLRGGEQKVAFASRASPKCKRILVQLPRVEHRLTDERVWRKES